MDKPNFQPPCRARRATPISRHWHTIVSATLRAFAAWRRARRCARDTAALRQLDASSLRDLGVHPSEFGSYWAEAQGQAEPSRRRVVHTAACRPAP